MNLPPIVSQEEWQAALDVIHAKEKEHTRARDVLAADRRRPPRVRGRQGLRVRRPERQSEVARLRGSHPAHRLPLMFGPNQEVGCDGCSMFTDQVGHLRPHARSRPVLALVSRAPIEKIEAYRERMGWTIPWYSWFGGDGVDFGTSPETPRVGESGRRVVRPAAIREGDDVFRTYFTTSRGAEALGSACDLPSTSHLSAARRREDSPEGYLQTKPY